MCTRTFLAVEVSMNGVGVGIIAKGPTGQAVMVGENEAPAETET